MKPRQVKRFVIVAICVTIVVLWQRQWMTDDRVSQNDTSNNIDRTDKLQDRPGYSYDDVESKEKNLTKDSRMRDVRGESNDFVEFEDHKPKTNNEIITEDEREKEENPYPTLKTINDVITDEEGEKEEEEGKKSKHEYTENSVKRLNDVGGKYENRLQDHPANSYHIVESIEKNLTKNNRIQDVRGERHEFVEFHKPKTNNDVLTDEEKEEEESRKSKHDHMENSVKKQDDARGKSENGVLHEDGQRFYDKNYKVQGTRGDGVKMFTRRPPSTEQKDILKEDNSFSKQNTLVNLQVPSSTPKMESVLLDTQNIQHDDPSDDENGDDESNLVNFMAQKNFHVHRENADAYREKETSGSRRKSEFSKSKQIDEFQSPVNVLLKTNDTLIKDDSNDFLGQVPSFGDYDLPILNITDRKTDYPAEIESSTTTSRLSRVHTEPVEDDASEDTYEETTLDENDDTMEGVLILGKVNKTRSYAVFSTTTEDRNALSFIFYIPLTVLAWKRIGYDSVVIIVGSKDDWDSDPLLFHVLTTTLNLDSVVIFLEPRPEKTVMISQVARIFAGNILRSAFPGIDDVYLVTSDADIWPIYGDAYALPHGKRILSLNSDCCTPFRHRGTIYKMVPMANIGMRIRTWRRITQKFGTSPKNIDDILTYFVQEFGTVALRPVHKGDNVGWYLDQMMISILISKWIGEHGSKTVKFVPRDVGVDRIDRAGWSFGQNKIQDKVDAHLLLEAYIPGVWVRITHLLREMYGDMTERYIWCANYYESFQKLFLEKYRSRQS